MKIPSTEKKSKKADCPSAQKQVYKGFTSYSTDQKQMWVLTITKENSNEKKSIFVVSMLRWQRRFFAYFYSRLATGTDVYYYFCCCLFRQNWQSKPEWNESRFQSEIYSFMWCAPRSRFFLLPRLFVWSKIVIKYSFGSVSKPHSDNIKRHRQKRDNQ